MTQKVLRGIRGATTVESNTIEDIRSATVELIKEITEKNDIKTSDISSIFFTMTDDLDKIYPAKCARDEFKEDFKYVPMMCYPELKIENSLRMCLRIMINVNTEKNQDEIKHIYLKGAKKLRTDLK